MYEDGYNVVSGGEAKTAHYLAIGQVITFCRRYAGDWVYDRENTKPICRTCARDLEQRKAASAQPAAPKPRSKWTTAGRQ